MTVYYIKYIVYQIYSNTHPDSHRSEKAECRIRQPYIPRSTLQCRDGVYVETEVKTGEYYM
jgi:hypothetical protein